MIDLSQYFVKGWNSCDGHSMILFVETQPEQSEQIGVLPKVLLDMPGFLLNKIGHESKRRMCDGLSADSLKPPHVGILASLAEFGSSPQRELADRLYYDPSDIVAWLDDLEGRELVERRRDPVDRRRQVVSITTDGKAVLRRMIKEMTKQQESMLGVLSRSERQALHELLSKIFASYDKRTNS
jgi:MarR family transcriptional regulator, lower aerobic nicotinate degradation pathway regulator